MNVQIPPWLKTDTDLNYLKFNRISLIHLQLFKYMFKLYFREEKNVKYSLHTLDTKSVIVTC